MPSVLSADALTTLDTFKEMSGIALADTSSDNMLERVINRTTAWIESETGRKLKARNYNGNSGTHGTTGVTAEDYIYFDGTTKNCGGDTIIENCLGEFHLPQWPIQKSPAANALTVELAVLSNRGSGLSGGETWDTTSLAEWDDFIVDYNRGIIRLLGGIFSVGQRNYRLKCTAGYQVDAVQPYVPGDLEALCLELGKQIYEDKKNLLSESLGTWSRSFDRLKEDPLVTSVLGQYSKIAL